MNNVNVHQHETGEKYITVQPQNGILLDARKNKVLEIQIQTEKEKRKKENNKVLS